MDAAGDRNRALLGWYRAHRRSLPWRDVADPYAVLVSEVMLQQTQAGRVAGRWLRFMDRFPTAADLSTAPLAAVLEEWSGLGYNTRALRLREAARRVTADGWPRTVDGLRGLPAVGPYTAAAIACFAFGAEVPAVDTNLRRVLGRWSGERLAGRRLENEARRLLGTPARDWNQAVMDLGATRCTPRSPRCEGCPVATWCAGPDAYEPPRPQPRFAGSDRQVRGAVVRVLAADGALPIGEVADRAGFPRQRVGEVAAALAGDGLVVTEGGTLRLAD
jgi:A/G-specific adenine glycosylase